MKSSTRYGRKNEIVTLIGDHGNMWIVEGETGNRFPVLTELLEDMASEAVAEIKVERVQIVEATSNIDKKPAKKIRKTNVHPKKPGDSLSLF